MKAGLTIITRCVVAILLVAAIAFVCAGDYTGFFEKKRSVSLDELRKRGNELLFGGYPDSAMNYYALVHASYRKNMSSDDKRQVAAALNNAGYVSFHYLNDYPQAYSCLLRSKEIWDEIGNPHGTGNVYLNLGNIYANYGDVSSSTRQYARSIDISLKNDDQQIYLLALLNLMIQAYMADDAESRRYLAAELARLDTVRLRPQPLLASIRLIANGIHLSSEKDVTGAASAFRNAYDRIDNPLTPERFKSNILGMISDLYVKNNFYSEAIAAAKEEIEYNRANGLLDLEGIGLANISEIYRKSGLKDSAEAYRLKSLEISDSLFNTRTYGTIRDLQANSDARFAAEQMLRLEQKRRMTLTITWIVGIAGAICLILLVYSIVKSRKLRRSYEDIYKHVSGSLNSNSPALIPAPHGGDHEVETEPRKYKSSPLDDVDMDELASKILSIMENSEEIYSPDFSLDRLAAMTGSKSKHISQTLGEKTGRSFSSLLSCYRVRQACRILEDPEQASRLTLEAIALDLGYKSRSHFATVFKKEIGITPGEYARISRKMKTACGKTGQY